MIVYFDGTAINNDIVTGLSYDSKMFNDDEVFTLGATICDTAKLTVDKKSVSQQPSVVSFTENGVTKTFNVDNIEEDDTSYIYDLVDDMVKFNFRYDAQPLIEASAKTESGTKYVYLYEILQDICDKAGVTLVTTDFMGADKHISYYDNTITAREYISMMAELNGGYAIIDGGLKLMPLQNGVTSTTTIQGNATLTNSSNASLSDYELKGNSYQYTTSGKNMITTFYDRGERYISYNIDNAKLTNTITYSFIPNFSLTSVDVNIRTISSTGIYNKGRINLVQDTPATFTMELTNEELQTLKGSSSIVQIYKSGSNFEGYEITNVQLESGSAATNFEPYTNGASPNPDYPQDIEVVTGRQEIIVCGKNLLYKAKKVSDTTLDFYFNKPSNKTLTFQFYSNVALTSNSLYLQSYGGRRVGLLTGSANSIITASFTLTDDEYEHLTTTNNILRVYKSGAVFELPTIYQLELGSTATTYEPYQKQSYNVDLPVENLLPNNPTGTISGVTYTINDDRSITLNGTYTGSGSTSITLGQVNFKEGIYYTLSGLIDGSSSTYRLWTDSNSSSGAFPLNHRLVVTTSPITLQALANENNVKVQLQVYSGANFDNLTIYPQLEKGTKASGYTPYGTTPIELCKIGDYQDKIAKNSGKNLFDKDNIQIAQAGTTLSILSSGIKATATGGGTYRYKGIVLPNINNLLGKQMTIQATITPSASNKGRVAFYEYNSSGNVIGNAIKSLNSSGSTTFTMPSSLSNNATGVCILFYSNSDGTLNANDYVNYTNVQVELGNNATEYEPYGKNQWYIEKKIDKITLNGSETWTSNGTNQTGKYRRQVDFSALVDNNYVKPANNNSYPALLSNYYIPVPAGGTGTYGCNQGASLNLTNHLLIYDNTYNTSDSTGFTTWLSTHNLIVYYAKITPTYTLIDNEELINQLNALENGYTYEPITNISINNDLLYWYITYVTNTTENIIDIVDCQDYKIGEYHIVTRVALDNGILQPIGNDNGSTIYINENNVYVTEQQDLYNIYNAVNGFNYYSVNATLGNLVLYDTGKCISINDGTKNYKFYSQIDANYNGSWGGKYHFITGSNQKEETYVINGVEDNYKRLKVQVDRNNNEIGLLAETKVDNDDYVKAEIISRINNGQGEAQINADNINLTGKNFNLTTDNMTISSTNFSVTNDGTVISKAGKIANFNIDNDGFTQSYYASYNYSQSDIDRIQDILMGTIQPTQEDYDKYDFDNIGTITSKDLLIVAKLVTYGITTTNPMNIKIKNGSNITNSAIILSVGMGNAEVEYTKLFLDGLVTKGIIANSVNAGNMDSGTDTITNSASGTTVYFNKTFTSVPNVVLTPITTASGAVSIKIIEITTTYFKAYNSTSQSVDACWIAMN